jgi:LemA protein
MTLLAIVIGLVALAFLYPVILFNRLVSYRFESEKAFSQIDVQLKRRHDLIPNLVETVKGVMEFERATLTRIAEARAGAMAAANLTSRFAAEGEISSLLSRVFAVWENYPQLKASSNAMQLQQELSSTENKIAYARTYYNDIVANYNTMIEMFPSNLVAILFNFKLKVFFQVLAGDREDVSVKI